MNRLIRGVGFALKAGSQDAVRDIGSATGLCCRGILLLLAVTLAGCSESPGGGGIGGTGKVGAPDGLIVGIVDGFGSVIVNDRRYETDTATVHADGEPATLSDLRVGMKVSVRVNSRQNDAVALSYQPDVVGAVSFVDEDLSKLTILGQRIVLSATTVFDELTPMEIVPGLALEISGVRDADSAIIATYIRKSLNSLNNVVVGRVEESAAGVGVVVGDAVIDVSLVAAEKSLTNEAYIATYMEEGTTVRLETLSVGSAHDTAPDEEIITSSFESNKLSNGTAGKQASYENWQGSDGIHIWKNNHGFSAADGKSWIQLDSDLGTTVTASYTLQPNKNYQLTFSSAPYPGYSANTNSFTVFWNGLLLDEIAVTGEGLSDLNWRAYRYEVHATGADTLSFRENDSDYSGAFLDNVSLAPLERTRLIATDVATVTTPPYNSGDNIELFGVVNRATGEGRYLVGDVLVAIGDGTEFVSSEGLPVEAAALDNRLVIVEGVALTGEGTVMAQRIKLLN